MLIMRSCTCIHRYALRMYTLQANVHQQMQCGHAACLDNKLKQGVHATDKAEAFGQNFEQLSPSYIMKLKGDMRQLATSLIPEVECLGIDNEHACESLYQLIILRIAYDNYWRGQHANMARKKRLKASCQHMVSFAQI